MRIFRYGLCFIALVVCSSHLAVAASAPSLSGTIIPSATQIVDANLNTWTLSGGEAYENGKATPSSGVILLLCYGGIVYQENIHHDWWLWNSVFSGVSSWVASSDPRVTSPGGTTLPAATQIIDSALNVWTLSGGQAYEKGQLTPSSDVILLLYAKGYVYQENIHHDWWVWRTGAWVATSAPPPASASGTTIPTATQIVDSGTDVWTVSGGQVYENHSLTPSSGVTTLLYYGGTVYQENIHDDWWAWSGQAWIPTASDPRIGQPLAYVASNTKAADGTYSQSVTVIDTGTHRVTSTITLAMPQLNYLAVAPNAKYVYAVGQAQYGTGVIEVIDTTQQSVVKTLNFSSSPSGLVASPDGTKVYVVYANNDTNGSVVAAINTAAFSVVSTLDIPGVNPGSVVSGITISPDGKRLYVPGYICACGSGGNDAAFINVIDTSTNTLASQFKAPTPPSSSGESLYGTVISPDNAKLYSGQDYYAPLINHQIVVLNPATGGFETSLPEVISPQVFSSDSQRLYGVGLHGVGVVNTVTDIPTTAVADIPLATQVAITPDGRHLYITDTTTNSVYVADTATYTISTILSVAMGASGAIAIASAH